jgi:hypothetical protein
MFRRKGVPLLLAAAAFWLSACARVHEPGTDSASAEGLQQVTLHVPDMIARQGIT